MEAKRTEKILVTVYTLAVATAAIALLSLPVRAFGAELSIPVPLAVVYPGQAVSVYGTEDKLFRIQASQLPLYAIEDEMLEGKVARRTLVPGKPIRLSDLKSPDIVEVGNATTMVYREAGLVITSLGMPLQAGAEGDTIRLRNTDSGVVVTGVVEADGSVRVGG